MVTSGAGRALQKLGPAAVEGLISVIRNPQHDGELLEAAEALGSIADERRLEPLIALLKHSSSYVRQIVIARALRENKNPRIKSALIELVEDPASSVRNAAIKVLIEDYQWVGDSAEQRVRRAIALREWGKAANEGAIAVEPLVAAMLNSEENLNSGIVFALAGMKDARCVKGLLCQLRKSEEFGYRDVADAIKSNMDATCCATFVQFLEDYHAEVRRTSAEMLGRLANPEAVEPLIKSLKDINKIRRSAVEALGRIADARALEPLLEVLKQDADAFTRGGAAQALEKLGDTRAVPSLVSALQDADESVRGYAAGALLRTFGYQPGSAEERITILIALRNWVALSEAGTIATPALAQALKDGAPFVRKEAAAVLGKIGGEAAVVALTQSLQDPDAEVRTSCVLALGEIGEQQSILPVMIMMRDQEVSVTAKKVLLMFLSRASEISVASLKALAGLADYKAKVLTEVEWGKSAWFVENLDCSKVRMLAQQELMRRGER
jgi:HEAT repeat protein